MKAFKEKIALVTGGANGIGAGIVHYFAERGALVHFCDIDTVNGERVAKEHGAVFYKADVTKAEEIHAMMDDICAKHGTIDIIINNAGVAKFTNFLDISIEEYDFVLATNLRSAFITSRYLARQRNTPEGRLRYGRIINLASTRYLQSEPNSEAYASSKGGIVSLTHALAISFAAYNITVNCISPGWIDTGHYKIRPEDLAQHPSQRVGTPLDVARACGYLCGEENDFINGQNLVLDGGMTKKMVYLEE